MKLGIVGLPNVGKSTLFNAITNAGAESANYPFCTIDPNVGVVAVPDHRLDALSEMYHPKKTTPAVVEFGKWLLISQVILYPAFGLCYMMTITFQTIGSSKTGLFLSLIRQGMFYIPFILLLPRIFGVSGIYLSQPAADALTILTCVILIRPMKRAASRKMAENRQEETDPRRRGEDG